MKQVTCVFFGRSGAGKGTQTDLLLKYLAKADQENATIHVETGQMLRDLTNKPSDFTGAIVKEALDGGLLIPAFLPIYLWASLLVDKIKTGKEHLVFDGIARRIEEAPLLESAVSFYKREKPVIMLLDIDPEKAKERLMKRGRYDDKAEKINERMKWFETDVMKSVNYFKSNPNYTYARIDGDQAPEKVHADILKALGI